MSPWWRFWGKKVNSEINPNIQKRAKDLEKKAGGQAATTNMPSVAAIISTPTSMQKTATAPNTEGLGESVRKFFAVARTTAETIKANTPVIIGELQSLYDKMAAGEPKETIQQTIGKAEKIMASDPVSSPVTIIENAVSSAKRYLPVLEYCFGANAAQSMNSIIDIASANKEVLGQAAKLASAMKTGWIDPVTNLASHEMAKLAVVSYVAPVPTAMAVASAVASNQKLGTQLGVSDIASAATATAALSLASFRGFVELCVPVVAGLVATYGGGPSQPTEDKPKVKTL